MMKKVRKNQWIDAVIYNGNNLLLTEPEKNPEEAIVTTVFICEGRYLQVGEMVDVDSVGRCILWHEPLMWWNNYAEYFDMKRVRVINCYPKFSRITENQSDIENVAYEISQYILNQNIKGNVLLIGHSEGGLIMYEAGRNIPHSDNRHVTILTISTPFGGSIMALSHDDFANIPKKHPSFMNWLHNKYCRYTAKSYVAPNSKFLKKLEPLPDEVNHISLMSYIEKDKTYIKRRFIDRVLERVNTYCNIKGDGIVSLDSQACWPKGREPEVCLVVFTTHASSLRFVLEDFGMRADSELFFSGIGELQEYEGLENFLENLLR